MALKELESMSLVDFHKELRAVLTSYYEDIVKMDGAGGLDRKVAYKRPIKRLEVPCRRLVRVRPPRPTAVLRSPRSLTRPSRPPPPAEPAEPAAAPAKPARRGKAAGPKKEK